MNTVPYVDLKKKIFINEYDSYLVLNNNNNNTYHYLVLLLTMMIMRCDEIEDGGEDDTLITICMAVWM